MTWPHFYGGSAVCKAVKYVQVLAPYLSSYTLVMTAVDRYQVSELEARTERICDLANL